MPESKFKIKPLDVVLAGVMSYSRLVPIIISPFRFRLRPRCFYWWWSGRRSSCCIARIMKKARSGRWRKTRSGGQRSRAVTMGQTTSRKQAGSHGTDWVPWAFVGSHKAPTA